LQTHDLGNDAVKDNEFHVLARKFGKLYTDKHPDDDDLPPDDAWLATFASSVNQHVFWVGSRNLGISITPLGWSLCGDGGQVELNEPKTRKEARDLFKALKLRWAIPKGTGR
jgi:hypothetical protein